MLLPPRGGGGGGGDVPWETVEVFWFRPTAEFLQSMLASYDIPVRLSADDLGGILPHIGLGTGGIAMQVPADRAEEARAILGEAQIITEDLPDPGMPWPEGPDQDGAQV